MPVTDRSGSPFKLYQRDQYAKGGLGRLYWDYRDRVALSLLTQRDETIVDLGCGEGITLEKIVRRFPRAEVLGLDLLEENVEICRKHGLPVRAGDVYDLDLPDGWADAVLLMEVMEHLERPADAIRVVHRVLKPGGRLVVLFPNDPFFKVARILTLRFREASYDPGHLRQWTIPSMKEFLELHRFRILGSRSLPLPMWRVSLHGLVLAARE